MEKERICSLNYEAEYNKIREELAKEKMQKENLREELKCAERKLAFYYGVQRTLEVVFGRDFPLL